MVISLLLTVSALVLQLWNPQGLEGVIFFGLIMLVALLYATWLYAKEKFGLIYMATKKITELEGKVNSISSFCKMDKRISILEYESNRKRKGQIDLDPSVLMLILLIILFYLYLRSSGYLP